MAEHSRRERRSPPPLDPASLDRLALRYVERFATSRGKLADYLRRKIRERGWNEAAAGADPVAVAERMAALGYLDDHAFAQARAGAMARRGLGERRVRGALRAAGIGEEDTAALASGIADVAAEAALAFARRRRIGPFAAAAPVDRAAREKQVAAMLRAGHPLTLARRIVSIGPGEPVPDDLTLSARCDAEEPC